MRLQTMEMKVLRVEGVTRVDCERNEGIRMESIKAGSSDDTSEEDQMVERQSDGESWQPNGESNERKSGGKETQRETEKRCSDDF